MTGGIAGAAGFLVAGPPGAVGGAAAAPLVTRSVRFVARELRERFLGPREEVRIGTALTFAIDQVQKRVESGEEVRSDDFFVSDEGSRSDGEEVVEGVLLAAQRSYEERKVPYYGRLLAGFAFDSSVSRSESSHLLQTFERISYQQFVLLQLFGTEGLLTRDEDWRESDEPFSHELIHVLADCYDLYAQGLINNGGPVMLGLTDLNPAAAEVQGVGGRMLNLMWVRQLEDATEGRRLLNILNKPPPSDQ